MEWMISYENRNVFMYCPLCSARPSGRREKRLYCPDCGLVFYLNVAAAVAGLIFDSQGRLLVTVRGQKPKEGMLDMPGGFIDPGESAEQALRQEIREELGLEIESMEYFGSAPNKYLYKECAMLRRIWLLSARPKTSLWLVRQMMSKRCYFSGPNRSNWRNLPLIRFEIS